MCKYFIACIRFAFMCLGEPHLNRNDILGQGKPAVRFVVGHSSHIEYAWMENNNKIKL
jgi:hypothetical protein